MALCVKEGSFYLDGIPISLIGGSVHYWRLERSLWPDILNRVKEMGFHTICTYIPWSVHEIARGEFDFGEIDTNLDINAFLVLCEEKGLHVLLRPGPHVNSEITYFGFPKRIVLDPEIQSRTSEGTPVVFPSPPRMFPVPSYASEKFYREVGLFFDHVCPIIVRHLHPDGCVIGVQADNEMSFYPAL
jgi:beta-galactosidase